MSDKLELAIDRTRCDGSRLCAELLPERIRLDDWGYPIITPGAIPAHLVPHARRAVAACPLLALSLRPAAAEQTMKGLTRASGAQRSMGPQ
ncbi:MAG TPA: ferredoxin [Candidatus Dormibacteraeota bacterium]